METKFGKETIYIYIQEKETERGRKINYCENQKIKNKKKNYCGFEIWLEFKTIIFFKCEKQIK